MGVCFSKNFRKMGEISTTTSSDNLHEIRANIIDLIHSFHMIKRFCVAGYETCIHEKLRETALIIKKKQRYIKRCLKNLRDGVKKLDDSIESGVKGNEKLDLIHEIQVIIREIDLQLFINDIQKIIHPDSDLAYPSKINEILDKKGLNDKSEEIYKEIDEKIAQISSKTNGETGIRRRYDRNRNNT